MFDLVRRRTGSGLDRVQWGLDGMLDRFFEGWPSVFSEEPLWPSVDVSESKKKFTVTAELPGLEAKDVDVSIENGVLTIKGEKRREHEEKDENYHRIERSYGRFSRSFKLDGIDEEKIKAKFKNGVLTLTLPKRKESVGKQIEVKEG